MNVRMECLICFDIINENDEYTLCDFCNTKVHTSCYKDWEKKSDLYQTCILCQQKGGLIKYNSFSFCSCLKKLFLKPLNDDYISIPNR